MHAGDDDTAQARFISALTAFRAFEMRLEMLLCLRDLAMLLCRRGNYEAGVSLAATASAGLERLNVARSERAEQRWQAQLATLKAGLGDADAFEAAWSAGLEADLDSVVGQALRPLPRPAPVES